MKVFKHIVIPVIVLTGLLFGSCKPQVEEVTAPTASVTVDEISRTSVTFTITSADAQDYAYSIVEKGSEAATAEELFQTGENGMFESGKVIVTREDLEGDKEYTLCYAVRKINPLVYSELYTTDLSTAIPYTEMLTLDKVGYTDYTYHVEVPEGANVKHISIKRLDFEAIQAIIGDYGDVTYSMYLATFGHVITESSDITIDKCAKTALDDDLFVYSGTDYILMAGVVGSDDKIVEESMEVIEFSTKKAEELPFNISIEVEAFSNKVIAKITPDEGITSYRVRIDSRKEYDYVGGEGEDHLKSFVIGPWYDESNMYTEAAEITSTGLRPLGDYVVGVVAFDAENGEKLVTYEFKTTEPVGPVPTIELTQVTPSDNSPWKSAAVNAKIANTIEIRGGFFPKKSLDDGLAAGNSLDVLVWNNGIVFTADELSAALSENGNTAEITELTPNTEYVYGVVAMNDEFVTTCDTLVFKTTVPPQTGGLVRFNMPGNYIASTTDTLGNVVTFPVTIATGANAETEAEYYTQNRLVCFGFGPEKDFPYVAPDAIGGDSTSKDYGPKWFIEFREGGKIIAPSTCVPGNTSELGWTMGLIGGKYAYMWGYGFRASGSTDACSIEYDVEVSEDGNTITIKGTKGEYGSTIYYPTMALATDTWWTDEVLFRCYSDLVLTRQ